MLRIPKGFCNKAQGWRAAPTLGRRSRNAQPQRGCGPTMLPSDITPLGLRRILRCIPRVARSSAFAWLRRDESQPWALRQNPVGIRGLSQRNLWVMQRTSSRFSYALGISRRADSYEPACSNSGREGKAASCRRTPKPAADGTNEWREPKL